MYLEKVISTSQGLLQETSLSKLCSKLLSVVLDNTTIEKIQILIRSGENYCIRGLADRSGFMKTIDQQAALSERSFPVTIFEIAKKSANTFSLHFDENSIHTSGDEYIKTIKPFVVYFIPIISNNQKLGYLYLENDKEDHDISVEELSFIEKLMPYIAISFRNVTIYENLNKDIEQSSTDLDAEKEKAEKYFENLKILGEIGKDIGAHHTIEGIINAVYDNVNKLMDATVFDIGVYNEKENRIEFPNSIERGKKLSFNYIDLNDNSKIGVLSFKYEKEVLIHNFTKEYNKYFPELVKPPKPTSGALTKSVIYLPLTIKGKKVGLMTVQSFKEAQYTTYHLNILKNLSGYISIALDSAMVYGEEKGKTEELLTITKEHEGELEKAYENIKTVTEIGQNITANLDVSGVLKTVYQNISNFIDAPTFAVGLHDQKMQRLNFYGIDNKNINEINQGSDSLNSKNLLSTWCFENEKTILINDKEAELKNYLPDVEQFPKQINNNSYIYIPLFGKKDKLGVITAQSAYKGAFDEANLNFMKNLALYVGIAMENAVQYEKLKGEVVSTSQEVSKKEEKISSQRDELAKAYRNVKLLSEIGQNIIKHLSVEKIISAVYEEINTLMEAQSFGIGLCDYLKKEITYTGFIKNGEVVPEFKEPLLKDQSLSGWSAMHSKEVFISNPEELEKYISDASKLVIPVDGSVIHIPLISKKHVIGVLTLQSPHTKAYTAAHLGIVRNIAIYTTIALINASSFKQMEIQKEELEKNSEKVTSSIKYAKRIQSAMLPVRTLIKEILPESFVFFKPRDIVSGDFFWFKKIKNKTFVAAVDCTGHGVPGAFMSMIGNNLLNEIVVSSHIESPDKILNELHEKITYLLRQGETDNKDGMDLSLCVIDDEEQKLEFAGAKNPLIVIKHDDLHLIKGDKLPIGGIQLDKPRDYRKHTLDISEPGMYYLFSDGYIDQFGGEDNSKFMLKRFKDLLLKINNQPVEDQRKELRKELQAWMKNQSMQTDDILVMGFRLGG